MSQLYTVYKKLISNNNIAKLKEKVGKNMYQVNINQRKGVVAMLVSDKVDF